MHSDDAGVAALDASVLAGRVAEMEALLQRIGDDCARQAAPHLLHLAAALGEAGICRVLLRARFDVSATDHLGFSPLLSAASGEHARRTPAHRQWYQRDEARRAADTARVLLEAGAAVDHCDAHGRTALFHGAAQGHRALLEVLLAHGARVDMLTGDGQSALHAASHRGAVAAIATLVADGVDPDIRDASGTTALDLAAANEFVHAAAALLLAGATPGGASDATRIHAFAAAGDLRRLEREIANGAEIDALDRRGRTPLHWACQTGRPHVIAALLQAGARQDPQDDTGARPIDYARSARHGESRIDAMRNAFARFSA